MNEEDSKRDAYQQDQDTPHIIPSIYRMIAPPEKNIDPGDAPKGKPEKPENAFKKRWKELRETGIDRFVELALAFCIAFFALAQLVVSCSNNASTTAQTQQLIEAAKISAYASQQNVQAARNFAGSAERINSGIGEAVENLNRQVVATETSRLSSVEQSNKLLESTVEHFNVEERPWIIFSATPTSGFQWEKAKEYGFFMEFTLSITNIGKTPATDVRVSLPKAVVITPGDDPIQAVALRDEVCDEAMKGNPQLGSIIYPGIPVSAPLSAYVSGRQIRAGAYHHTGVSIIVAACVTYRPTYNVAKPFTFGVVYSIEQKFAGEPLEDYLHFRDTTPGQLVLVPNKWTPPDIN